MSAESKSHFRGVVGGIEYTDGPLFEIAARNLGFRRGRGRCARTWKVGTPISVVLNDGTRVNGQVWSMADRGNYAWLALDDGQYVTVYMPRPDAIYSSPGRGAVGRVAA